MFVISIGEDILNNDLNSTNASLEAKDFLDDTFSLTVTFEEPKIEQNTPTKIEKSDDLFTPPQGLEVESGSDIVAKRKGKRSIPRRYHY